ncbi:4Fe-4S dicluster domain-containing protein [Gemmiger formicilis]|uniref:4Fe-4S dicluster domain-containing protein n=1 Tax=Gemmiger formicilis TaxID=745368 RepID=UPI00195C0E77|nr:4Fe-4S dicluster domain-containing protein [Gemmiger formicilis]MBM6715548.1 4Fe-4S dicluster domain-containing protein [Gemmiger formicilis]
MRGIYTPVTDIRRKVFTEVARMAYEVSDKQDIDYLMRELPYEIIPGEERSLRSSIFLERAIVSERIRLAMGLSLRPLDESVSASEGLDSIITADKYYEPPLINVIKYACNKCPEKLIKVTSLCQGCLAHPCQEVCPKKAISFRNGKSHIDQSLCVKCGRCVATCPYNAIVRVERPCAKACGMDAIHSDQYGRAEIDYNKCVSCGMCLVNCPFGAIVDKGQIFQLIQSIKRGDRVIAIVAPAFVNQFPGVTPAKLREAMKLLGFAGISEVAIGADLCTIDEAKDFMEEVPSKHPFMGTSCCPAWSVMAKKLFPEYADCISMTMTPMVLTARLIKKDDKNARICFIGPCAAKKLEASRRSVRSEVDFVLTFEELMGLFEAKEIDFSSLPDDPNDNFDEASGDGRGFAVSGGVAQAVVNVIKKLDPDREVKVASAQGLAECRKMMMMAKAGKYNGYLLEGMGCPGGCIAGAGTLADPARSAAMLAKYKTQAPMANPLDTPYRENLDALKY